jgi:hypothetical protein
MDEVKRVLFSTSVAASVAVTEDPRDIPAITAARIWDNLQAYALTGTWEGDRSGQ